MRILKCRHKTIAQGLHMRCTLMFWHRWTNRIHLNEMS